MPEKFEKNVCVQFLSPTKDRFLASPGTWGKKGSKNGENGPKLNVWGVHDL